MFSMTNHRGRGGAGCGAYSFFCVATCHSGKDGKNYLYLFNQEYKIYLFVILLNNSKQQINVQIVVFLAH